MSLDLRGPSGPTVTRPSSHPANVRSAKKNVPLKVWGWIWPKAVAIGLVLLVWQIAIWTEWKPPYVLPSPSTVFSALWDELTGNGRAEKTIWEQLALTMKRGLTGYALAILIGTALGIAVVQWRVMRMGVGSLIAGLHPFAPWSP